MWWVIFLLEHVRAIESLLTPLGYPMHRGYASKVTAQYLVLRAPGVGGDDELPLSGPRESFEDVLRVTAVAGTYDGVSIMLRRVSQVLSPGREWRRVPMPGWQLHTRFVRSEFIDVDTSVTLTSSGLHPSFGVDTYQMAAEPITGG